MTNVDAKNLATVLTITALLLSGCTIEKIEDTTTKIKVRTVPETTTTTTTTTTSTPGYCIDSDNGENPFEKGTTQENRGPIQEDTCKNQKELIEWVCENNKAKNITHQCLQGCTEGRCQLKNTTTTTRKTTTSTTTSTRSTTTSSTTTTTTTSTTTTTTTSTSTTTSTTNTTTTTTTSTTTTTTPYRPPPCGSYGDIDGDGYVTGEDVEEITQNMENTALNRGDTDGNGIVDPTDIALMIQYINRQTDTFPVCR